MLSLFPVIEIDEGKETAVSDNSSRINNSQILIK